MATARNFEVVYGKYVHRSLKIYTKMYHRITSLWY